LGISNATTKYITNWNIDDLRHPINTKIKFDLLEKNDHIAMVHNWYVATTDENETFYNLDMSSKSYLAFPDDYHTKVLENCYAGPDPMWRKSLHDAVGYFDNEKFATIGDWEMWIRFAKHGAKFKLIPEILCIYLDHDSTVSKKQADRVILEKNNLIQKYGYVL
jgi:GT2 family glycosyltransferase